MVEKMKHDVVYFVKDTPLNPELVYSLRSLEKNWSYNDVWFCGGCPERLKPDHHMKIKQIGFNKWEKVRYSIHLVCLNDQISDDFWLFNDDFFILKKSQDYKPQYNGRIDEYIELIKARHNGSHSEYTLRLLGTIRALEEAGCSTLNYEIHKPMLINKGKALEVLEKFNGVGGFRSLYGNYWKIGGIDRHDMKIKQMSYGRMDLVENEWDYLSTTDNSFQIGEVGRFIRDNFSERSRFEV